MKAMKPFCCLKGVKNIIKQKGLDLLFEIIESINCVCLSVHAQITEPSFIHFESENDGTLAFEKDIGFFLPQK